MPHLTDGAKAAIIRLASAKLMTEFPQAESLKLTMAEVAELPAIALAKFYDLIQKSGEG